MIKTLSKVKMVGKCLNTIKATFDKPTSKVKLNGEKEKVFSLRSGTRQGCLLLLLLFIIILDFLVTAIRQEEIKVVQIGKEEVKLSLFVYDIILNRKNPRDSIKKLLKLINGFNKRAEYKINIQKLVVYLYANNELFEIETQKTIPFTIALKIPRNKSNRR